MGARIALLVLAAGGCGSSVEVTLAPVPASCPRAGTIDHLVVTVEGDAPGVPAALTLSANGAITAKLDGSSHVVALAGIAADGRVAAIGRSAPFDVGPLGAGAIPLAWAAPDLACAVAAMTPRFDHSATLTPSGVLMVGGRDAKGPVAAVDLFQGGAFRAGAPLAQPVYGHVALALPDGTVLIAGGVDASGAATARSIRVAGDGSIAKGTQPLRVARAFASAALLPGGQVLVTGGCSQLTPGADRCDPPSLLGSSEIYLPDEHGYAAGPPLLAPRAHHQSFARGDGSVLVTGGIAPGGDAATAEVLTPSAATSTDRVGSGLGVAVVTGGALLVGGESTASTQTAYFLLGPGEAPFQLAPLPAPVARPTVTSLEDGAVLVAGGLDGSGAPTGQLLLVERGVVRPLPPIPARVAHTATLLPDGTVLIAGGRDGTGAATGDAQLLVHSLLGPFATVPTQDFQDPAAVLLLPRHPARELVEGGQLAIHGGAEAMDHRPSEFALIAGMSPLTVEVTLEAGRSTPEGAAAVILGWRDDANYRFVTLRPGAPVTLSTVAPTTSGASATFASGVCRGSPLLDGDLPLGATAPLRVAAQGHQVRVSAGDRVLLDCVDTAAVPRGMVGVGSIVGGVRVRSLAAVRR